METRDFVSPTVEDLMMYDRIFKRSLKCKCFALMFCITGTVNLLLLPLDFLESNFLSMIMPTFLSGYIVVNLAGILTACRGHVDIISDIFLSSIATVANFLCGIYMIYYWVDWVISTLGSSKGIEGALFLVLSLSCMLNAIAMGGQFVSSVLELKRRVD